MIKKVIHYQIGNNLSLRYDDNGGHLFNTNLNESLLWLSDSDIAKIALIAIEMFAHEDLSMRYEIEGRLEDRAND